MNLLDRYQTEWGGTTTAVAAESASALVWGDDPVSVLDGYRAMGLVTSGAEA